MRIRKPRGFSTIQLMVVTVVGFAGGVYIWQPLFQSLQPSSKSEPTKESVSSAVDKPTQNPVTTDKQTA